MFNFLDPKVIPRVTTKSPALDTYEVENLISADSLTKSRGFIAYSTVKPPVDVDFELICEVALSYISICTEVGSHSSSSIEVFVKNSNTMQFISICKSVYNGRKISGIIFCNRRYCLKDKLPVQYSKYDIVYFKGTEFRAFLNTNRVRVRILRTNGSVPCLGNIEIWGNISKMCSFDTKNTVHKLINKNKDSILTDKGRSVSNINNCKPFNIPEEFLDALTYELMAVPMTLPSGHTIDQSTLEKCLATDASYGRFECDPFTGLKYTDNRRPVVNVALKTRIDMFLIENSHRHETFSLKRTLGKERNYPEPIIDSSSSTLYAYSDLALSSKKIKLDTTATNSDLNDAVNNVLNNTNFIRYTSDLVNKTTCVDSNSTDSACACCSNNEYLYILPCKHLYCRQCSLQIKNQSVCKICNAEFLKNDIKRYHC